MTLQQLRCVLAVADNGFGVSRAAAMLHTTQSNVSKTLRALEEELKFDIFVRRGNQLMGLTETGKDALVLIRRASRSRRRMRASSRRTWKQALASRCCRSSRSNRASAGCR